MGEKRNSELLHAAFSKMRITWNRVNSSEFLFNLTISCSISLQYEFAYALLGYVKDLKTCCISNRSSASFQCAF